MSKQWDEASLQRFINDEVEESLTLEYKASGSLDKDEKKKSEITKDVSALANSAGGLLIYGIREYQQPDKKHLPEKLDPINRTQISKEWLEQVIGSIRPKIIDLVIHPVSIGSDSRHVVYVVEVPQSVVPHQANDKIYYKRHNFRSIAMEDYEIADIRGRILRASSLVTIDTDIRDDVVSLFILRNIGNLPAHDVQFHFSPEPVWDADEKPRLFAEGIRFLSPGKVYSFFYRSYIELANQPTKFPNAFDVAISYFHPGMGKRMAENVHLDFIDYEGTQIDRSELERHSSTIEKAITELTSELKKLNSKFEYLPSVTGATGLDLSITTLRNLRHLREGTDQIEKIDPKFKSVRVFREVLGIDLELALKLRSFFSNSSNANNVSEVEGVTEEIFAKIQTYFKI
jgi:Putative DNA-binding domain